MTDITPENALDPGKGTTLERAKRDSLFPGDRIARRRKRAPNPWIPITEEETT